MFTKTSLIIFSLEPNCSVKAFIIHCINLLIMSTCDVINMIDLQNLIRSHPGLIPFRAVTLKGA